MVEIPFKQATPRHGGIAEIATNQWAARREDRIQPAGRRRVSEQSEQRQFWNTTFANTLKRIKNICYVAKNI